MHLLTPKRASGADTIRDVLGPPPWAPEQDCQILKSAEKALGMQDEVSLFTLPGLAGPPRGAWWVLAVSSGGNGTPRSWCFGLLGWQSPALLLGRLHLLG